MRALVIANPVANQGYMGKNFKKIRSGLENSLGLVADKIDWAFTQYPLHAINLASEAVNSGYKYIFAAGGDGTVNEVINGIVSEDDSYITGKTVLGIIPLGSGNDFYNGILKMARSTNIQSEKVNGSKEILVDIGKVTFDSQSRFFCLGVGLGFIAWGNIQRNKINRVLSGRLAYIVAAVFALATYRNKTFLEIILDKKIKAYNGPTSMIMINNGETVGGGVYKVLPNARLNDGVLDICIIENVSSWKLAYIISKSQNGSHIFSPNVRIERASEISIIANFPLPIHIDGENPLSEVTWGVKKIDIDAKHLKLCVLNPEFYYKRV